MKLAAGKVNDCPFPRAAVEDGRQLVFVALEMAGAKLDVRTRAPDQPFYLGAIEELLRISGDPDHKAYSSATNSFAKGVRLGVGAKLPRVPAVFERKTTWKNMRMTWLKLICVKTISPQSSNLQ